MLGSLHSCQVQLQSYYPQCENYKAKHHILNNSGTQLEGQQQFLLTLNPVPLFPTLISWDSTKHKAAGNKQTSNYHRQMHKAPPSLLPMCSWERTLPCLSFLLMWESERKSKRLLIWSPNSKVQSIPRLQERKSLVRSCQECPLPGNTSHSWHNFQGAQHQSYKVKSETLIGFINPSLTHAHCDLWTWYINGWAQHH